MPDHNARVFARLLDWSDPAPSLPGQLRVRLEYSLLDGDRKDGKYTLVTKVINVHQLGQDLTEGLVSFLNAKYPTAHYRERDIALWGT
jgi:hypothetical protein